MFREMRRKNQLLSEKECIEILERGTSGVLAVSGDDGYPYAVPLSYSYEEGKLFFHGATTGHKLDSIKRNEKISFCVIDQDEIHTEEFTTYYRSVIVFGRARILTDKDEIITDTMKLTRKYAPEYMKEGLEETYRTIDHLGVIELTVEHMTGKESKFLRNKP